jgi:guanylate kinase
MKSSLSRLVILAGPSCVGKSPLNKALLRFNPELEQKLKPLVLYNSREPRPGERDGIDYHFRTREQIQALDDGERFVVMDVRGDLQALDVQQLKSDLADSDVFFEGNPFMGEILMTHPGLDGIDRLGVFMSPLSREEILFLRDQENVCLPDLVTDVMRRKGELSLRDLENIETRASSAYSELRKAHRFQHVIPNHDGEDSENWDAFYFPLGDARRALDAFTALLAGAPAESAENWEDTLLPR